MKDRIEVVSLQPHHVRHIVSQNLSENSSLKSSVSVDEMIRSYLAQGSAAYCLFINGMPIIAGGIMNFGWKRGEAWLLSCSLFEKHVKTCYRVIKQMLPGLAELHKFRRVQAVTMTPGEKSLFKHLGFKFEAELESYGPDGQTCYLFKRVF
jgi:hypothetical protein